MARICYTYSKWIKVTLRPSQLTVTFKLELCSPPPTRSDIYPLAANSSAISTLVTAICFLSLLKRKVL